MKAWTGIAVILICTTIRSATYYVDYDSGDDTRAGTAATTAWKHAPGDVNATGTAASRVLTGGDVVQFKSDVIYRGSIVMKYSGTAASSITYKGDGWGTGKAVLDGSEIISSAWTQCASAADVRGNSNWPHIYYTALPSGVSAFFTAFYENDEFLWPAQDPNPSEFINFDDIGDFRVIPNNTPGAVVACASLTDPAYFTQADAGYWQGSYVGIHVLPNIVAIQPITGFTPGTHTIAFPTMCTNGVQVYTNQDQHYMVINHPGYIDQPGEVVIDTTAHRIYVWPYGDPQQDVFTVAKRSRGFDLNAKRNIVIEGFVIRKYFADFNWWNGGVAVWCGNDGAGNARQIIIRNCEVTRLRSMSRAGAIQLGDSSVAEDNYLHFNQRNVGILGGAMRPVIRRNHVDYCTAQGIWFMGTQYGIIADNLVTNIRGAHSNAISVYLNSSHILVARNRVYNCNDCGTIEESDDLYLYNNYFDGGNSSAFYDWGGMGATYILNNIFLQGVGLGSADNVYVFKNNIVNGGGSGDRTNNIYTDFQWWQRGTGWAPDPTEIIGQAADDGEYGAADMSGIFVNAPRVHTGITAFSSTTVLFIHDNYQHVVDVGNYLVIDGDTAHVRTVTASAFTYSGDQGNPRTRVTFTPALATASGTMVDVWKTNTNFTWDCRLKAGSLAQDQGADLSAILPVSMFPEFDFTLDLAGNPRINNGVMDIGPYEYTPDGLRSADRCRKNDIRLGIFPQPANILTNVEFRLTGVTRITVCDLAGRCRATLDLACQSRLYVGRDWEAGMYLVRDERDLTLLGTFVVIR